MTDDNLTWEQMVRGEDGTGRADRLGNDDTWPHPAIACEGGVDHVWQPVQLILETGGFQPDMVEGKCFVVCMVCHSWSYILTEWAGFYVASPEVTRLEESEPHDAE